MSVSFLRHLNGPAACNVWAKPPHHHGKMHVHLSLNVFIHFSNWVMHTCHCNFIVKCQLAFDSYIKFENGTTHVQCCKCTHSNSLVLKMWIEMRTRYIIRITANFQASYFHIIFVLTVGFCIIASHIL